MLARKSGIKYTIISDEISVKKDVAVATQMLGCKLRSLDRNPVEGEGWFCFIRTPLEKGCIYYTTCKTAGSVKNARDRIAG
jgi:hypothetical protein